LVIEHTIGIIFNKKSANPEYPNPEFPNSNHQSPNMAGIYIHIPFCKKACHYCNFHFSTSLKNKSAMLKAMIREVELQKNYLQGEPIETIYFGGGTPSMLEKSELMELFEAIYRHHSVVSNPEITLEANPDDLTEAKIRELKSTPVNRLSIGIQSFAEIDLRWMNRAHTAEESIQCLQHVLNIGFEDITIDLIYGAPTTTHAQWETNLRQTLDLHIPHISAYCLTVEEGTALHSFVKKGKSAPTDDVHSSQQFQTLTETLGKNGYDHYEISNFALPNRYARHNTNYWRGVKYVGIGASAHSFDGESRQWNVANNALYIQAVKMNAIPQEKELLTPAQRHNEYIMTSLRTMWGCELGKINPIFQANFLKEVAVFIEKGWIIRQKDNFCLTNNGKLFADFVASELFV
jgi:oxygen-independent coproporphyrinogen III oxidase